MVEHIRVAPLAGAWIEIELSEEEIKCILVAPLAGAWIEIRLYRNLKVRQIASLPSRERGLKWLKILCPLWSI